MNTKPTLDELFERRITYPDIDPQSRLARLVGLDEQKNRLAKILGLLVNLAGLADWANEFDFDGGRGRSYTAALTFPLAMAKA